MNLTLMKKLFTTKTFLVFAFLLSSPVFGQVVTFTPSFATQFDSVTITFDATQGNGDLAGFTGDVYLHTGVITTKSSSPSDWQYVPNGWDEYPSKVLATSLGNNKWEFTYSPSVREFFGITDETEEVLEIAMLFRGTNTGTGSPVAVGRGTGDEDIFIELTAGEAAARFVTPEGEFDFIQSTETLDLVGIGTVNSGDLTLTLLKNESEVTSTSEDTLRYTFDPEPSDTDVLFELVASNGTGLADTASFFVTVREGNGPAVSRPAGTRDGITYTSDTSVRLSLYAPFKQFVYVLGDFNDWTPSSAYLMNKEFNTSDSVWYWLDIDGLIAGQEYGFQYLIDGDIRIADPYSELVLDEFNDSFIPESVFPNIKEYPQGKTTQYVGLLSPGKESYQWEVTDFDAPDNDKLVIYELLIRDFIEDHSYSTLIDTLDYLENLGINAIELMPVNEFEGNISWGYNPSFHMALDKYYGPPNEFKRFIDEAHKRGIAVIVDIVLNHAFGSNPLVRMWNDGEFGSPTNDNPYLNRTAKHDFNVGYDFDHESPVTRRYSKRVMEYWLEEYNLDGFRFDLSKGFTQNNTLGDVGAWNQFDQSRIDIWFDYYNYIKSVNPEAYVILEHFSDNSEEKVLADGGMMLWGNINHEYNEATMGYPSNLSGVLSSSRGFNFGHLVSYMESHDEQWLMFKNISFGNSDGDYNVRSLPTALDRMELAGVFFFPLPGPRMLWQFGELGYGYGDAGEQCLRDSPDCPVSAPGRTDPKPIRWDYYDDPDRKELYDVWSAVINLRNSSEAFTRPTNDNTFYSLGGTVKYFRHTHPESDVVAIGNFGVTETTQNVDFTRDGTWYNFFEDTQTEVSGGVQQITLAPGEYKLFTTKLFGMPTSSELDENGLPARFALHQNYPNPFNPSTNITFDVAKTGLVTVEIYNLLGQKVADLVNESRAAGTYTVRFDASGLSSGVYIARFTAGNVVQTQKMMLLK